MSRRPIPAVRRGRGATGRRASRTAVGVVVVALAAAGCSQALTGTAVAAGGSSTTAHGSSGNPAYDQLFITARDVPSGYQKTATDAATALAGQKDYLKANTETPAGCATIQAVNDKAVQEGGQRYTYLDSTTQSTVNQFIAPADSSDFDGFAAAVARCATFTVTHNADGAVIVKGSVTPVEVPPVDGLDIIGLRTAFQDVDVSTVNITYIARNRRAGITMSIGATSTSVAGQLDEATFTAIADKALAELAAAG